MSAPRLEIDLEKLEHNAATLVGRLGARGIGVTGVTKAFLGEPTIARALLRGGVAALGDSRLENLETMRRAGIEAPMCLIRSPTPRQAERAVNLADMSLVTEVAVIRSLDAASEAAGTRHGIVVMVELGDLREGVMPDDVEGIVRTVLDRPHLSLQGVGANLACRSGVVPDLANMTVLSDLATSIEATFGLDLAIVSGGNSANLTWALESPNTGRIDDLRLGEAILLGRETLHRAPIDGLHLDAITFVAEVIESKAKPARPWGDLAETAFGAPADHTVARSGYQTILAAGHQDIDPAGISPPPGVTILGASSDHLVIDCGRQIPPGSEVRFQLNYSAMLRAMTSPFVARTQVTPDRGPVWAARP